MMEESPLIRPSVPALIRLGAQASELPLDRRVGQAQLAGGYQSPFKGRGMEFNESRPYEPGDDVRRLDWRVTARTGKPHTKLYHEERERPVLLWVDYRRPMHFATRGCYKSVRAAECAALLAWSALRQGDRVGGIVFSESVHHELRPRRGRAAVLDLIHQLAAASLSDTLTGENQVGDRALLRLSRVTRPGSLVFLLSDFRGLATGSDSHLLRLALHSEVVLVFIHDPLERELPPPGRYRVTDGRRSVDVDSSASAVCRRHEEQFANHRERLLRLARRPNVHYIECTTDAALLPALQRGMGLRPAA